MPSRDYDPPHDEHRPEGRWSGEPPPETGWREPERRYGRGPQPEGRERRTEAEGSPPQTFTQRPDAPPTGGSAFAAAPRQGRGPEGLGSSYGGAGGRASGSQAYGYPADQEPERPAPAGAWERRLQEARRGGAPLPGRAGPGREPGTEHRGSRHGWERNDETQFDADYKLWREEQMRMLDREYAQWRQERYRKFAEEFSQWRAQRLQAQHTAPPRAHPEEPASLGEFSALGPAGAGPHADERELREPERPPGLLSGLLGGHGERHKPKG